MLPPLAGRRQECLVCLVFTVAGSGVLIADGCWGTGESSVLTVKLLKLLCLVCFALFGLSWKLMTGDNLVPLNFALAAEVQAETHVIYLCQYLLAPSICTNTG